LPIKAPFLRRRRHLDGKDVDLQETRVGVELARRVRPQKFLDDHRLADVGLAVKQQSRHAGAPRAGQQALQLLQRLPGSRIVDPLVFDQGWQLEIAMPWRSLELLTTARSVPPHAGDLWRIFLGRFHRFILGGKEVLPHPASVLTVHGVYDTHQPDKWSRVLFVD